MLRAAMLAKDIINSQRYSFYTDYSDMWILPIVMEVQTKKQFFL